MTVKEKHDKHTNICFSVEDTARLDALCAQYHRTRSDVIRLLILMEHEECFTGTRPHVEPRYQSAPATLPKPKPSPKGSKSNPAR
jgi:hypothetical protein